MSRTKWCLVFVALVGLASVAISSAQDQQRGDRRPGQGGAGGRGGFPFGGGGGALGLLQREEVQEELELLGDQKKQLTELGEKAGQRIREAFGNLRGDGGGGNDAARGEEIRETMRKANEQTQAELDKILLPHQSKRLKQLEAQMQMRGRGVLGGLADGNIAEKLGVSEDQRDKLRDKARDLDSELRKKTSEIRKQLQDQLLASLSEEQRAQYKELIGEPFEFKDDGPGFGFGGFGGQGGPGGGGQGGIGRRGGGDRDRNNNN